MEHQPRLRITKRLALQAGQPMAQPRVVAFHGIGFLLGLHQLLGRNHHRVHLPVVAHHPTDGNVLNALPKLVTGGIAPAAQHEVNETVAIAVDGYPDPYEVTLRSSLAVVFLCPT